MKETIRSLWMPAVGMLTGTRRLVTLLATLLLTMTAQTAWADWVTYIDENGNEKNESNAKVLNGGGATTLQAGLYVVKDDITYTGTVTLSGNVKIVLNDGCTMNIGTSESRLSGKGFYYNNNESLTIYGQTNGTGALSVYTTGESNYAIWAGAITINGGHVTADTDGSSAYAIYAEAITINGGHVTAHTAGNDARAIYSRISAFTYNGGIVSASTEDTSSFDYRYNAPAIASYSNYTFNWRSATDRITIGSTGLSFDPNAPSGYEKTATFSKPFSDGTTTYSGALTGNELSALAGKTLLPAYTITYDLAGGTVATDNPDSYTIESAAITLNNPTREGYTFAGWTGTGLDAATTTVTIAHGSTGHRSYTATWRKLLTNTDITVSIPSQEWTGSELAPVITVKDGETALTETTDYTVTLPSGRTNSGDYTVTLTGAGNYDGTTTKTFTITPKVLEAHGAINVCQDQNGTTATLDGASEGSFSITADVAVADVKLNRTFESGKKTTVCWPFAVLYTEAAALGKFYKFKSINGEGKIEMEEVTSGLEANKPYIFEPSSDKTLIDFGAKTLKAGGPQSVGSGFTFKGIYGLVKWTTDTSDPLYDATFAGELGKAYGFALKDVTVGTTAYQKGQFVKLGSGAYGRAFRAYLLSDGTWDGRQPAVGAARTRSAASSLPDVIDIVWIPAQSRTTGISTVGAASETDGWYSLDGRKLDGKPTKKGLYINNGKKVVIK